jgi:hypothetical protein
MIILLLDYSIFIFFYFQFEANEWFIEKDLSVKLLPMIDPLKILLLFFKIEGDLLFLYFFFISIGSYNLTLNFTLFDDEQFERLVFCSLAYEIWC